MQQHFRISDRVLIEVRQPVQHFLGKQTRLRGGLRSTATAIDLITGQMLRAQRNQDNEGRPASHLAFNTDRAAVQFDQFLHQGQPDAAPLMRASAGVFDPVKPFEQQRHVLGRDAGAGVPHAQFRGAVGLPYRDGNFALKSKFEGVGQQVEDDLLPHRPVHEHRLTERWAINAK